MPTIGSVTVTPVNSNSVISGWGIYVQGKTQATIKINNAAGSYGSTIKAYSISNSYLGSVQSSTMTTAAINRSGTFTMTATVTDSRGRTATKTASFTVYAYAAPAFSFITMYRCNSSGTRSDTEGTYGYVKANFGCSALSGSNKVTATAKLTQVGGSYTQSTSLTSGTRVIMGGGNLAVDATYSVVLTLTDTVGTVSTYTGEISSAVYIMHIKKGGKAVGFGMAAGEDETVSFGWPVKLENPLEVTQGGTGGATPSAACVNIGAVRKNGDTMTGNLTISGNLYPSLYLTPTYNSTTNRTVFEGSYVGASSFSSWEDSTGNNRRMLEVRNAAYQSSLDQALVLRNVVNGSYYSYRIFHAGMSTPVPVANGGTAASTPKAALNNLGIFYSATLPSSGTDGQICLVPV